MGITANARKSMKKINSILMILAVAAGFTNCTKVNIVENNKDGAVVYATTGEVTKTTLSDDYKVLWSQGDQVKFVKDGDATTKYTFDLESGSGTASGTFTCTETPKEGTYTVYYPASYDGTNWPAQTYVNATDISGAPMTATATVGSDGSISDITFANEGGILRYTVKGTKSIKSINVKSGSALDVTLGCGDGVELTAEGTVFNIALPAGTYTDATLTFTATDNTVATMTASEFIVKKNVVSLATFEGLAFKGTASIELCTSWDKELAYATEYTQDYTINNLNGGTTIMTLKAKGVYRSGTANTYFQMNKKAGYFKNTTKLPGKITKIETTWSAAKGPTTCYFATDGEASSTDSKVEVTSATSVTYTPDAENEYYFFNIDVSTGTGAAQMTSCVVYYETSTTPQKELVSLEIGGSATKTTYYVGDSFDPSGLTVEAKYDDASTADVTDKVTWTMDPETFDAASASTSVEVTAKIGAIESASKTISGIVVNAKEQTYANTYTSNVTLSTDGGTSASTAKVVIKGTNYDALKAGASKTAGACVVTIPANTKTLHFHAAGWSGETVKLDVNGTKYSLVADTGVTGNSPFTLSNDPEENDYFTFDPKGATTITFTATQGNRFVLFGVNAELTPAP